MRFIDDNIKININGIIFKAYLEESETIHELKEQQLPFAPVTFLNDTMATRLMEKVKLSFNVFSETRAECIDNFNNLKKLINSLKPNYHLIEDQYVPFKDNINGYVSLFFSGLPIHEKVKLHVTSFSYSVNKEIGYIQVPIKEIAKKEASAYYDKGGMKLIPLAYKINIEGKSLLDFDSTIIKHGTRMQVGNQDFDQAYDGVGGDSAYKQKLGGILTGVTGNADAQYSDKTLPLALATAKDMADGGLVNNDGTFADTLWKDGKKVEETAEQKKQRQDRYNDLSSKMKQYKTVEQGGE